MERILHEVGVNPTIVISAIGGDLRVSGRDGEQLEALAPEKGELTVETTKKGVEISCRSGCLLYLPKGSRLEAGDVVLLHGSTVATNALLERKGARVVLVISMSGDMNFCI